MNNKHQNEHENTKNDQDAGFLSVDNKDPLRKQKDIKIVLEFFIKTLNVNVSLN